MIQFEESYRPELQGGRYMIDIPFNLWEAFQCRGKFDVCCTINEIPFTLSPMPKGKGLYRLSLTKEIQKKLALQSGGIMRISMEPILPEKKQDNDKKGSRGPAPLRLVMQNTPQTCGQACIAMLAGVPLEEAVAVMHTSGPTSIGQLIQALDHYGIAHSGKNTRLSKKNPELPEMAVLTVHFPEYAHWVVYHKGKYYDPEFGLLDACHPEGRVTSFLQIHTEAGGDV